MEIKHLLKLLEKKYPTGNRALLIYDDESGRIIDKAFNHPYEDGNTLFEFDNVDELVSHLEEE